RLPLRADPPRGPGGGAGARRREAPSREPRVRQARDGRRRPPGQPRLPGRSLPGAQEGVRHRRGDRTGGDRAPGRSTRAAAGAAREEGSGGEGMNVTRVYLVRHGATELSAEDRFAGETDVALSELGREQ